VITLAISSLKGGVGKTTCAVNLAYSLAKRGWKTLLVDADPQGSVGLSLSPNVQAYEGLYEILTHGRSLEEVALRTKLGTLGIVMAGKIPSNDISRWCTGLQDGQSLKPFFEKVGEAGYEIVVLDTPSGLHGPTEGILRNCTHVVVPQQCEPLALRALMMTVDFLTELQGEDGQSCELAGVILTMADPDVPESRQIVEEIKRVLPPEMVCQALVPRDPAVINASMRGMPLGLVRSEAPPPIALAFDQLAAELETKLELSRPEQTDDYVSLVV
jgi:chromosome partitioning protein